MELRPPVWARAIVRSSIGAEWYVPVTADQHYLGNVAVQPANAVALQQGILNIRFASTSKWEFLPLQTAKRYRVEVRHAPNSSPKISAELSPEQAIETAECWRLLHPPFAQIRVVPSGLCHTGKREVEHEAPERYQVYISSGSGRSRMGRDFNREEAETYARTWVSEYGAGAEALVSRISKPVMRFTTKVTTTTEVVRADI